MKLSMDRFERQGFHTDINLDGMRLHRNHTRSMKVVEGHPQKRAIVCEDCQQILLFGHEVFSTYFPAPVTDEYGNRDYEPREVSNILEVMISVEERINRLEEILCLEKSYEEGA